VHRAHPPAMQSLCHGGEGCVHGAALKHQPVTVGW
jgi:hypothetical protein